MLLKVVNKWNSKTEGEEVVVSGPDGTDAFVVTSVGYSAMKCKSKEADPNKAHCFYAFNIFRSFAVE